jgi:hypothetical protein
MGMAPSLKLSIDVLPFNLANFDASLLVSGSMRFGNDVPLEFDDGREAYTDVQHKNQMSIGALLKMNVSKNVDLGIGLDFRQDWMVANGIAGTDSEESLWRPWLRAQARYLFDQGKNVTYFVGAEAGFALASVDIHPSNYYRDYYINTGQRPLGEISDPSKPSPDSFTRGHMPTMEFAIVGGIRFGRHCGR